jgi:hypothetical protein
VETAIPEVGDFEKSAIGFFVQSFLVMLFFLIFSFYTTFHSVIINPSNKKGRVNCPAFLLRVNY